MTPELNPGVTGDSYGRAKATWFQNFMYDLNSALPQEVKVPTASPEAFYARVAKAMRGAPKPGKSRL